MHVFLFPPVFFRREKQTPGAWKNKVTEATQKRGGPFTRTLVSTNARFCFLYLFPAREKNAGSLVQQSSGRNPKGGVHLPEQLSLLMHAFFFLLFLFPAREKNAGSLVKQSNGRNPKGGVHLPEHLSLLMHAFVFFICFRREKKTPRAWYNKVAEGTQKGGSIYQNSCLY